jgi:hypothetical protein
MRRKLSTAWALVVPVLAVVLLAGQLPASAVSPAHNTVVSAVPGARTPHVVDGKVTDIEEVGNRIVVTGTFTQVRNTASSPILNRFKVFAFDPVTGEVDPAFAPTVAGTGATLNTAAVGPNGTVYLGGVFTTLNGTTIRNIAQVSLATGALTSFRPAATNGAVNDLVVSGSRLFVGGVFTTVAGQVHRGLAALNAATGARDPYMGVDVAVNHNWTEGSTGAKGAVGVSSMDISPDGQRLVAIGNFKQADGLVRDQAVSVLLQATAAVVDPDWRTQRYEARCLASAYDFYVREVEFSPDGAYFVIVTTGAHFAGTLCDTAARWEVSDTGQNVQPRWISDTGGDTLHSVAISGAAVYVGGHQRWMNNPLAGDRAGPGAVPRPGIAALDPSNGVPLPWNPGRNPRGIGAEALLVTSTGLYVGMDTDYFGNRQYLRRKLGFFPLAGGAAPASKTTPALPATVWLAGRQTAAPGAPVDAVLTRFYDGTTAGADAQGPTGDVAWSRARGAFMVGGTLFYGFPNAAGSYQLVRRTFNGTTYGPATFITTPYLDPAWAGVATGTGTVTYDGALPNLYGTELSTVTGMFYANGKLYYTRSGSAALFSRGFSVDSGIVEAPVTTVAATGFGDAGGMFVSGGNLYVANRTNGDLRRMAFSNGVPSGTATVISGPSRDGRDWRTTAMFLGPAGSGGGTTPPPPAEGVALRGVAENATPGGGTSIGLTVPVVEPGDGLVLVLSTNSAVTGNLPAGFRQRAVQTVETSTTNPAPQMTTQVFEKVATGNEDNTRLTVTLTGGAKATLQLVAYEGTAAAGPIRSVSSAGQSGGTSHATPGATATAGDWVLSAWSNKSSAARTWTAPAGEEVRSNLPGTGLPGEISTLVTDGGSAVPTSGSVPRLTATTSSTSAKATMFTIVIAGA